MGDLSAENAYLFLLLVLPGFIAVSIYDLFIAAPDRNAATSFFLGLAYGSLNLLLTWPLVWWAARSVAGQAPVCTQIWGYAALLFSLGVIPALLGFVTYKVRESLWFSRVARITPHATAWDNFFGRREPCWMIFHLKNGAKVGGHYAVGSHASSFPNEPDIYVREVWRLDQHCRFEEKVDLTMGMLISRKDCDLIEIIREED